MEDTKEFKTKIYFILFQSIQHITPIYTPIIRDEKTTMMVSFYAIINEIPKMQILVLSIAPPFYILDSQIIQNT
jgi:hypothetical protein